MAVGHRFQQRTDSFFGLRSLHGAQNAFTDGIFDSLRQVCRRIDPREDVVVADSLFAAEELSTLEREPQFVAVGVAMENHGRQFGGFFLIGRLPAHPRAEFQYGRIVHRRVGGTQMQGEQRSHGKVGGAEFVVFLVVLGLGSEDIHLLHGARHGHVGRVDGVQALHLLLLLQAILENRVVQLILGRERNQLDICEFAFRLTPNHGRVGGREFFVEERQDHHLEVQSLGLVDGHHRDGVVALGRGNLAIHPHLLPPLHESGEVGSELVGVGNHIVQEGQQERLVALGDVVHIFAQERVAGFIEGIRVAGGGRELREGIEESLHQGQVHRVGRICDKGEQRGEPLDAQARTQRQRILRHHRIAQREQGLCNLRPFVVGPDQERDVRAFRIALRKFSHQVGKPLHHPFLPEIG